MRPSVALELQRAAVRAVVAARKGVSNPRVFGSVGRREDTESSDLDLLVDVHAGATLFDLGGLQEELEELLGVRVDVLTVADLPIKFRANELAEAKAI